MHKIIESNRQPQANTLQIPIAQSQRLSHNYRDPAVSSPEYYPTPAPIGDAIRKPLLAGRHLIILNKRRRTLLLDNLVSGRDIKQN